MDACERVLCEVDTFEDATLRRIAAAADAQPSAISYHFGSQERLVVAVAERVYLRLNAERLSLLNRAITRAAPKLPPLEHVIEALVGPSIRWSLDPRSSYRVLAHMTQSAQRSREPGLYRDIVEGVEHHRAFMQHLALHAPWLSEADIGWRVACALGIRSQLLRSRARTEVLTDHSIDFSDPEIAIRQMVEVIVPMFRRPG
jgi:AcrR family transcriptional regulator